MTDADMHCQCTLVDAGATAAALVDLDATVDSKFFGGCRAVQTMAGYRDAVMGGRSIG